MDVLDSFAGDVDEFGRPVDAAGAPIPVDSVSVPCAARDAASSSADPSVSDAVQKPKRGRPKGTTAAELRRRQLFADPLVCGRPPGHEGEASTRVDCARLGGLAKAAKRPRAEPVVTDQPLSQSARPAADLALVPHAEASQPVSLFTDVESQSTIVGWNLTRRTLAPHHTEARLLRDVLKIQSKQVLAEKLGIGVRTVTRHLRVLGCCLLLIRKHVSERNFLAVDTWLRSLGTCDRVMFALKYKYDEMSMRVRLETAANDEEALAKMVQVQCTWIGLWKVLGRYVKFRAFMPTSLKAIESCSVNCMRTVLDGHVQMPTLARSFATQVRLPTADQHVSNVGVDYSYCRDYPSEAMQKFHCFAHVEKKVADIAFDVYPNERKGLLHLCLAANYAGMMLKIKRGLKQRIRRGFKWHEGTCPDMKENEFRELLYRHVYNVGGGCGVYNVAKEAMFNSRSRLLNGRFGLRGCVEHWCKDRCCCEGPEDTLRKLEALVDKELGPKTWTTHRWTGVEDCEGWVLFWSGAHNLLPEVLSEVFADKDAKKDAANAGEPADDAADGDEVMALEDDYNRSDARGHLPEQDLGMPDPVADETHHQRQATYRANALLWIRSGPVGRLWTVSTVLHIQQNSQRLLIKHSSASTKRREMTKQMAGGGATYKVVLAAEGLFWKDAMLDYTKLMRTEEAWNGLPTSYLSHELAVHSFRCLSGCVCIKTETQVTMFLTYPFMPYLLLSRIPGAKERAAGRVAHDFRDCPCSMDVFWFLHARTFPSPEALMSEDSLAVIETLADEIEFDCIGVETSNANIHRSIKKAVHSRVAHLLDISASWVLRNDRKFHTDLMGDATYTADAQADKFDGEEAGAVQTRGGGGLCRAFVSHMSERAECRKDGAPDFSVIMKKYAEECAKESSPILDELKQAAQDATMARRQQHATGALDKNAKERMSAFGVVHAKEARRVQREACLQRVCALIPDASVSEVDADVSSASPAQLALGSGGMASTLAVYGFKTLDDQLSVLRSVSRRKASQRRILEQRAEDDLRAKLADGTDICGMGSSTLKEGGNTRAIKGALVTHLNIHDDIVDVVQKKVAAMAKFREKGGIFQRCQDLWTHEHRLLTDAEAVQVGTIPAACKPTHCFLHGRGMCICRGRGYIASLAANNLGREVGRRAPNKSKLRGLIRCCYVCFRIADRWYHVGYHKFNPRRATLLQVIPRPERVWDHVVVDPIYVEKDGVVMPKVLTVHQALCELDLEHPLEVSLHRLVAFNRELPAWRPDRLLTIAPLHLSVDVPESIPFWKGRAAEVADEELRKKRKLEAEARRRARQPPPSGGAVPSHPPGVQRQHVQLAGYRSEQAARGGDADLAVLCDADVGDEAGADGDGADDGVCSSHDGDRPEDADVVIAEVLDEHRGDDPFFDLVLGGTDGSDCSDHGDATADAGKKKPSFRNTNGPAVLIGDQSEESEEAGDSDGGSPQYSPTSPAHSRDGDDVCPGGADDVMDEPQPDEFVPPVVPVVVAEPELEVAAESRVSGRRAGAQAVPCTADRSAQQPPDCTLRRYDPPNKASYWLGLLPKGKSDGDNRSTRTRSFREGGIRSEEEAIADIEAWLLQHSS